MKSISWHTVQNVIQISEIWHERLRKTRYNTKYSALYIVFLLYISCYISENRLPLGQCTVSVFIVSFSGREAKRSRIFLMKPQHCQQENGMVSRVSRFFEKQKSKTNLQIMRNVSWYFLSRVFGIFMHQVPLHSWLLSKRKKMSLKIRTL